MPRGDAAGARLSHRPRRRALDAHPCGRQHRLPVHGAPPTPAPPRCGRPIPSPTSRPTRRRPTSCAGDARRPASPTSPSAPTSRTRSLRSSPSWLAGKTSPTYRCKRASACRCRRADDSRNGVAVAVHLDEAPTSSRASSREADRTPSRGRPARPVAMRTPTCRGRPRHRQQPGWSHQMGNPLGYRGKIQHLVTRRAIDEKRTTPRIPGRHNARICRVESVSVGRRLARAAPGRVGADVPLRLIFRACHRRPSSGWAVGERPQLRPTARSAETILPDVAFGAASYR
jgi:hypothetical protein